MSTLYAPQYLSRQAKNANPKRLVIACDGTWQSSVELDATKGVPSNITRLCRILANSGTGRDENGNEVVWQQIVHYDAGVGTADHSWQGIQSMKEGQHILTSHQVVVDTNLCFYYRVSGNRALGECC